MYAILKASALVISLSHLIACSHAKQHQEGKAPSEAEKLYNEAMSDLDDGLYPEAIKGFSDVKARFPYSEFAPLADLRTADAHFKHDKFIEAIDAYRLFLKYHPRHREAPYATFQVAEAYWEQVPSDWWFMPPSAEKDQQSVTLAISAYTDVVTLYPSSEFAAKAGDKIKVARRKLADHEFYVAKFYFKRKQYKATAARIDGILKEYAGLGFDEEGLWMYGRSKHALGELDASREAFERLVTEFPNGDKAADAKKYLQELQRATSAVETQESSLDDTATTVPNTP